MRAMAFALALVISSNATAEQIPIPDAQLEELTNLGREAVRAAYRTGDIALAWRRNREAEIHGSIPAHANIGLLYLRGLGVEKDEARGLAMLKAAAATGHPRVMFVLGATLGGRKKSDDQNSEAKQWLERAAAAGNSDAMAMLAEAFKYGVGIPKDPTAADAVRADARNMLQRAAEAGDDKARLALARIYMHGIHVPVDFSRAEDLLLSGAKPENVVIRRYLGTLYLDHPERYQDAHRVFKALADDGDHGGMNHLKRMYYSGLGVPQDYQKAAFWEVQSAKATQSGIGNPSRRGILRHLLPGPHKPAPRAYILALQTLLKEDGYYSGPLDGKDTDEFARILSEYPHGPDPRTADQDHE
ncbi:MAG: tetratricopeptide repeat protein [Pseudomonadota bacterium]